MNDIEIDVLDELVEAESIEEIIDAVDMLSCELKTPISEMIITAAGVMIANMIERGEL